MKPKPLASLNHFTVPCSAMLIGCFLSIDLRWRDSEVLKAGYWLVGESCSRPIRSNAVIIVRSVRTIGKPRVEMPAALCHDLVDFSVPRDMRSLVQHTFLQLRGLRYHRGGIISHPGWKGPTAAWV